MAQFLSQSGRKKNMKSNSNWFMWEWHEILFPPPPLKKGGKIGVGESAFSRVKGHWPFNHSGGGGAQRYWYLSIILVLKYKEIKVHNISQYQSHNLQISDQNEAENTQAIISVCRHLYTLVHVFSNNTFLCFAIGNGLLTPEKVLYHPDFLLGKYWHSTLFKLVEKLLS